MTVNYEANGEASDWMLGDRGIIAMSPELGTKDKSAQHFFIRTPKAVQNVVFENLKWVDDVLHLFDENFSQKKLPKSKIKELNAKLPVKNINKTLYGH